MDSWAPQGFQAKIREKMSGSALGRACRRARARRRNPVILSDKPFILLGRRDFSSLRFHQGPVLGHDHRAAEPQPETWRFFASSRLCGKACPNIHHEDTKTRRIMKRFR